MVENEVVFRKHNRAAQEGLENLKRTAEEEGQAILLDPETVRLHFYCECANEDCKDRIQLEAGRYKHIHKNERTFIVLPDHEVIDIERVVRRTKAYTVVEKRMRPPKHVTALKPTHL